jgi:aryl-alcohol dehydrogenase-like predicted oxidoreductase
MEYRNLGGSGCAVSTFALGTMTFGDSTDAAGAFAQLDAFAEDGGTLVDTADVYVDGASETITGPPTSPNEQCWRPKAGSRPAGSPTGRVCPAVTSIGH